MLDSCAGRRARQTAAPQDPPRQLVVCGLLRLRRRYGSVGDQCGIDRETLGEMLLEGSVEGLGTFRRVDQPHAAVPEEERGDVGLAGAGGELANTAADVRDGAEPLLAQAAQSVRHRRRRFAEAGGVVAGSAFDRQGDVDVDGQVVADRDLVAVLRVSGGVSRRDCDRGVLLCGARGDGVDRGGCRAERDLGGGPGVSAQDGLWRLRVASAVVAQRIAGGDEHKGQP